MADLVLIDHPADHVARITLNRPERLNAMSIDLVIDLWHALEEVAAENDTWVVVLTGAGSAFSSGLDLKDYGIIPNIDGLQVGRIAERSMRYYSRLIPKMRDIPQPIVAAINGPAFGGGMCLSLGADLRLASESAVFNATGIVNGLSSTEMGISFLLPRLIGGAHSNDLLLTGRRIDAAEALRMGLVSRVFVDDAIADAAVQVAADMTRFSPYGLAMTKETIWANVEVASLQAAIELEDRNQLMMGFTNNLPEAIRAFDQGREPSFTDEPLARHLATAVGLTSHYAAPVEKIRVGVFGAGGRMGSTVCGAVFNDPDLELVAAVDPYHSGIEVSSVAGVAGCDVQIAGHPEVFVDAGVQVAIDFTEAKAVRQNLVFLARNGIHSVVGTTGLSDDDIATFERMFTSSNCLIAPNFAIGAVLMMKFAAMAAPYFETAEIIEFHHDGKVDAPSGTAMLTAQRMSAASEQWAPDPTTDTVLEGARGAAGDAIRIHSVRMRGMVAHQEVVLGTTGQTLVIRHDSIDRTSFMPGVLMATKAITSVPGVTVGLDTLLGFVTWIIPASLVAGFGSGILASVLGVGGAVITTPFIRVLGATPIHAVGSTVPAILPGAVTGSLRYQREGYVVWRVALTCGLSGMSFAVLGGWVADNVDARWLMVATALLVMWCGASLLREGVRLNAAKAAAEAAVESGGESDHLVASPSPIEPRGGVPAMVALGVVAGFLAGLLGVGGGLLLTPGLTVGLRLPVKNAIATSLTAVAMMSTTAVVTHIALGHVDWRFALPLAVGIVPGARVGARLTINASEQRMRLVAGGLLIVVAAIYLGVELHAM